MATARMRKLKIVGRKDDQKAILELLTRSGCFEVSEAEKAIPEIYKPGPEAESLKSKQAKVAFAIEYLNAINLEARELNKKTQKAEKKRQTNDSELFEISKHSSSFSRTSLSYEDYDAVRINEEEFLTVCDKLEKNSLTRTQAYSKIQEHNNLKLQFELYRNVEAPFSKFRDTKTAGVFLMTGPDGADKQDIEKHGCYVEEYLCKKNSLWGVLCKIKDKPLILRKLKALNFEQCTFLYEKTAQELIKEANSEIEKLERLFRKKTREALAYQSRLNELKAFYDVLEFDIEHIAVEPNLYKTETSVIIEGWAPETAVASINKKLKKEIAGIYVESRGVEKGDEPPSMLANLRIVRPFESVTKGYSAPSYGDVDPSIVMSFFFFIFFGIMLADAGYGLIMAVVGLLVGAFVKLETPLRRMILMFGICGISGIIFGFLFGGFFAIEGLPPLWFNPLDDPITMLAFSLGLGAVHLLAGYTLKTVGSIRTSLMPEGLSGGNRVLRIIDGLFDSIFMYALFGGILFFLLPMLFSGSNFPFTAVAIALLAVALTGILLTTGRKSKSLGGKVVGGLGGLYRLINVFSDVLSYARLFGLALASGAIAMAFNQIGMLVIDVPFVGYVLGVIALVVLHGFNFVLSALAAYVHNIRLQYVEFFGKFYDGNGRLFAPLGENTKYVRFVEKVGKTF